MHPAPRPRVTATASAAAVALLAGLLLAPPSAAIPRPTTPDPTPVAAGEPHIADSAELRTWWHDDAAPTTDPIDDGQVRQSAFYDARVTASSDPDSSYDSFVYMSVPRSGNDKIGYTEEDGAEFSSAADLTMSWSSFEYSTDVWVEVTLRTGQTITSADQVTVRPTDLGLEKELVDASTIRVKVPFSEDGYRFSVEFDPQLITAYNDMSGASGVLTTDPDGNRAISTEPQNSMLVFANPKLSPAEEERTVPTEASGSVHRPQPGTVDDLDTITEEIVYFGPGTYSMGSTYHAVLPENVRWVYLAPGAYVKGAFRFPHETQSQFKVTGLGVLSGEQYVYEADTSSGYQHNVNDNCHVTCVKMLQFESSTEQQTLDLQGVTINQPPYHSFVVYAHEGETEVGVENFQMNVDNYKQVGSWYWQTDGIELYDGGRMKNTFFHANDDVLKMYHSDVAIENTVIWKNENGPVVQWGWTPRDIENVTVTNTDIIHNRMYWKDVKYNTCIFNSSSHWEDMGATDRADTTTAVKNMRFVDTRVEGMTNCAVRAFALSNTQNVEIDGLHIDEWNKLDASAQVSLLTRHADSTGTKVTLGNEVVDGNGLLLHDYTVGTVPILKAGDNWSSGELGRLNFDADTWDSWNATSDDQATGPAPILNVNGLQDGQTSTSRTLPISGTTDAKSVTITVNGIDTPAKISDGQFSTTVTLEEISNRVRVTAVGDNGVINAQRFNVLAFGTKLGSLTDPSGDDDGPGTYLYPSDAAFNPGSLDLTGLDVFEDGDTIRFAVSTAGEIRNPWGGRGMSTQRVNIYLSDRSSSTPAPLLPGTNTSADGPWQYALVADGRNDTSRFGGGLYDADLTKTADVQLTVIPNGTIVSSVPASALTGLDLRTAGYQVSMFSAAEDGEGIGNVRPIYSAECWQGSGCPAFVGPYRGGGGAGDWTDTNPERDTDSSDSNAYDIISGATSQAHVMNWTTGSVVVPYVTLDSTTTLPIKITPSIRCIAGRAFVAVRAENTSDTPLTITLSTPYGSKTFLDVPPGATPYQSFATRSTSVNAGIVTVTTTTTGDDPTTVVSHSPYSAHHC
ncbi:family 49 glycosyl hydrolase [Oerskovia sp. Sa1BUA8]|uniref:Family 49 glycosyl hydrolase n=1 Tax=Oerskovia douganii TaxID=2762210 RepID=A0A9D5YXF0_9CELL|nr:glucodextranase DOMON-like domain-containing protein [Oerskovia douganii]MBE7699115.1 family 49 glycosyl hydrolase [Oerskovia douganii]